jgi:hypothetical protein
MSSTLNFLGGNGDGYIVSIKLPGAARSMIAEPNTWYIDRFSSLRTVTLYLTALQQLGLALFKVVSDLQALPYRKALTPLGKPLLTTVPAFQA